MFPDNNLQLTNLNSKHTVIPVILDQGLNGLNLDSQTVGSALSLFIRAEDNPALLSLVSVVKMVW